MRILPILFSTEMVRGILEERKTVTRRVIRGVETSWSFQGMERDPAVFHVRADGEACPKTVKGLYATFEADPGVWFPIFKAPYEPGDILYVRETWAKTLNDNCKGNITGICPYESCENPKGPCFEEEYVYKASDSLPSWEKWRPSIHMPKEAARIFLKVKAVRVERLQEITDEQARAEGIVEWHIGMGESGFSTSPNADTFFEGPIGAFRSLWDSTIKPADRDKYGWGANPWVWVIEFERTDKPEGWPGRV